MSKKQLDSASVVLVVNELLKNFGSTTNLDIKNALRAKGFWATQTEVSDMMAQLVNTEDWEVANNGSYNTYTAAVPVTQTNTTGQSTTIVDDDVTRTVSNLFGIHKFAMSAKTRLSDLGLDYTQIEKLTDELGAKLKKSVSSALKTASTTLGELQDYFKSDDEDEDEDVIPTSSAVGSMAVNNQPMQPNSKVIHVPAYKVPHIPVNAFGQQLKKRRAKVSLSPLNVPTGLKNDELAKKVAANEIDGDDWVMSKNGLVNTRMVYDGKETRDHVRTAYARLNNVPIQRVRSRRVKNIENELAYTGFLPAV